MRDEQQAFLQKAERTLETARLNLSHDDPEAAINRAFYAAYYAATAALREVGETPKTHNGTLRRFSFHFIEPGKLPVSVGNIFVLAFDARQRADYDAFSIFEKGPTADLIEDVQRFVDTVREMLGRV